MSKVLTLRRPRAAEIVGVLALAATLTIAARIGLRGGRSEHQLDVLDAVLLVGACVLLLLRHQRPRAVLVSIGVCGAGYLLLGAPGYFVAWPFAVALYTVVARGGLLFGSVAAALGTGCVLLTGSGPLAHRDGELDATFWVGVLHGVAVLLGENRRRRNAYVEAVEERMRLSERAAAESGLRHASEERLRIARELHDSLTHALSVVNVQAGVAAHLLAPRSDRDDAGYRALVDIRAASQEALRELRSTLEVLRSPDERPGARPTLRRLDEVCEQARAAGNRVSAERNGLPDQLPGEIDRTAFRIVQEALTNVVRHAPGADVRVRVAARGGVLALDIVDDGAGRAVDATPEGHGLTGMRERAESVGGTLRAEPSTGTGFTVSARLPLREVAAGSADAERR